MINPNLVVGWFLIGFGMLSMSVGLAIYVISFLNVLINFVSVDSRGVVMRGGNIGLLTQLLTAIRDLLDSVRGLLEILPRYARAPVLLIFIGFSCMGAGFGILSYTPLPTG